MSNPEIIIHIGLDKTGTTSLQAFCAAHREALGEAGYLYPHSTRYPDHHLDLAEKFGFSWSRLDDTDDADGIRPAYLAQFGGPAAILLSSEHFCFYSDIRAIQNLHAWLREHRPGHRVRIVLFLRNQIDWLVSVYAESLKWGCRDDFDTFYTAARPRLRFADLLADWRRVFGPDSVTVLDYDAGRDTVGAFLATLAVPDALAALAENYTPPFANPSLPPVLLEAIRRSPVALNRDTRYDAIVGMARDTSFMAGIEDAGPVWDLPTLLLSDLPDLRDGNEAICRELGLDGAKMRDLAGVARRHAERRRGTDPGRVERCIEQARDAVLTVFTALKG